MDITDNNNENERNEENLFDGDFIKFLENQNNKISASVKKDEDKKLKRSNSFDNLEEESYPKTELNKKNTFKTHKKKEKEKSNENVKNINFIQKKTSRKIDDIKKKKKNTEFKTKTEINDYQAIKEKNKNFFDNYSGYQDQDITDNFINIYEESGEPEGTPNLYEDFDANVEVNQHKQAYECKTNANNSEMLNMFISSEINK